MAYIVSLYKYSVIVKLLCKIGSENNLILEVLKKELSKIEIHNVGKKFLNKLMYESKILYTNLMNPS